MENNLQSCIPPSMKQLLMLLCMSRILLERQRLNFCVLQYLLFPFNNQISIAESSQNKGIVTPEGNILPPPLPVYNTSKKESFESTDLFFFFPPKISKIPRQIICYGSRSKSYVFAFSPGVSVRMLFLSI